MAGSKQIESCRAKAWHIKFTGDITAADIMYELSRIPGNAMVACVGVQHEPPITFHMEFQQVCEHEPEPWLPVVDATDSKEAAKPAVDDEEIVARQAAWDQGFDEYHRYIRSPDLHGALRDAWSDGWSYASTIASLAAGNLKDVAVLHNELAEYARPTV